MAPQTVELRFPAAQSYVLLARTAAAGLAARLDFTLDRLEDLRLAVDEAVALLLVDARPDAEVVCRFTFGQPPVADLLVTVQAATVHGRAPAVGSFAWTVLSALVDEVSARTEPDGTVEIRLRSAPVPAGSP